MLVVDVSYDLLDDILQCDKSRSAAVLVHDYGYMRPLELHPSEKDSRLEGLGHVSDRLDDLFRVLYGSDIVVVEILQIDDADDVVQVILINRQSGQSGCLEDLLDLRDRRSSFDRDYVNPRCEDVDGLDVVEFDRVRDELALLLTYGSACLCLFDYRQKLILAELRLIILAKGLFEQNLESVEDERQRSQYEYECPDEWRQEERYLLGVLPGEYLR